MLIRAIALSLALLIGIGAIIPIATEFADAKTKQSQRHKKKRYWRGVKKYSKRWWQLYRAQERRKRANAKRRRTLRLRQLRLAKARAAETGTSSESTASRGSSARNVRTEPSKSAVLPTGDPAPSRWKTAETSPSELQFRVDNSSGDQVGSASITVVGPAVADSQVNSRNKSVGGVATTSLRREVINKMIQENGWVVNDYQKEIGGRPVYVVVAQSQARNGRVQSRMFYYTEVDGRIYSVATNSPVEESERLAEESEKVINSLQRRVRPAQRAALK